MAYSHMPETLSLPDLDALDLAALKAIILHQHVPQSGPQRRSHAVRDGQLEIDNNAAERALRIALGRKNFLFAGSESGGERAAAMYSLLGSAKLNGLDAAIYLHHVLERIADHPISRINDLLPWNLALPTPHAPS